MVKTVNKNAKPGSKGHATQELLKFFKSHQITKAPSGNIRVKQQESQINYEDLVKDLTTDNKKKKPNLTNSELEIALAHLHEIGLPTSLIRSAALKAKYKKIKEQTGTFAVEQQPSTSQQPAKVTPQKKKGKRRFESIGKAFEKAAWEATKKPPPPKKRGKEKKEFGTPLHRQLSRRWRQAAGDGYDTE